MIEYVTNRSLEGPSGKGRIKIIKLKEESLASVEYVCPMCGFEEKKKKEWKRPFSIRCDNCNHLIRVPKLRTEIKKMRRS